MRPVSQLKVFIAHAAVGIFALANPAGAATLFINLDTTITATNSGDAGATGAANTDGSDGTQSLVWDAAGVDVFLDQSGLTLLLNGGDGGAAGEDTANNGGNVGGFGAMALDMSEGNGSLSSLTVSVNDAVILGGKGGAGAAGGTGGASDTDGGDGGYGGAGIFIGADDNTVDLTSVLIMGGKGGPGGAAGNAAGDASDNNFGGDGGKGGNGVLIGNGVSGTTLTFTDVVVIGGVGGDGGTSLAFGANSNGGSGGNGIYDDGNNTTINLVASTVLGGAGGSPGQIGGAALYLGGTGGISNKINIDADSIVASALAPAVVIDNTSAPYINNYGQLGDPVGQAYSAILFEGVPNSVFNYSTGKIESAGSSATIWGANGAALGGNVLNNAGLIRNYDFGNAIDVWKLGSTFINSGIIQAGDASAMVVRNGAGGMSGVLYNTGGSFLNDSAFDATIVLNHNANLTLEGGSVANADADGDAILLGGNFTGSQLRLDDATVTGDIVFTNDAKNLRLESATTLNGDIEFADGANELHFNSFFGSGTGVQTIAAGSTLNTTGNGTVSISVFSTANTVINADWATNSKISSLEVFAGGVLTVNDELAVVAGSGATITNDGTIVIGSDALFSGDTATGNGTWVFKVSNDSAGALFLLSSALDFTGQTVEIAVDQPSVLFANGAEILIADGTGAATGPADGTQVNDNSALMNFVLYRGDNPEVTSGDSTNYWVKVQLLLLADIAALGDDPNSVALGAALDAIGLDGDADLDDLMLALAQLPTNEDINATLDALLPETDGIAFDLATDAGDQALDVASKRLDALLAGRLANTYRLASVAPVALRGSVNDTRGAGRFWVQAFGRTVDQSQHSFNTGYDATSYGFAFGADTNLDNATALGAAFSYTSTDANGNGINQTDTDVDSYQLTLYGDHLFDNATYAKGLLAYGWHANDIARHDVGGIPGNTATGSYDADHITARAEFGRAYKGGDTLTLIPRAHLNAAWYSPDGYSEQGVGGLGLTVAPDDLTSVRLGVGVLARWDITLSGEELFQPELRLDYRRDLTRERFETTSVFLGAPGITFRTQGVDPAADILNLGVGALLATAGGVDLRASYDVELKEDYTAHAGYLRASIPF